MATKFAALHIPSKADQELMVEGTMCLYRDYLKKWSPSDNDAISIKPTSTFTVPRRGQLRLNNTLTHSRFGHTGRTTVVPNNQDDDMPVLSEAELIKREVLQQFDYDASNTLFKKKMRCVRKRDRKEHDKLSSTSGTSNSATAIGHILKSNFNPDIQSLESVEDSKVVLQFDSVECALLTLMQRAKLFVKLRYQRHRLFKAMELVRAVKFKRQSNVMINESTLPTKGQLIKILKEELYLDYRLLEAPGIASIKERIILMIFMRHAVLSDEKEIGSREQLTKILSERTGLPHAGDGEEKRLEAVLQQSFQAILNDQSPELRKEFDSYMTIQEKA